MGACPDKVIFGKENQDIVLLEIKCPHNKRNLFTECIITGKSFYIALNKDKKPYLRKEHHLCYCTQIQVSMGLTEWKWSHFFINVCSGIIIVKVDFDRDYFISAICKINDFYKDYYINGLLSRGNSEWKLYMVTIWLQILLLDSWTPDLNHFSFYLPQNIFDLESEQRIRNKIYTKLQFGSTDRHLFVYYTCSFCYKKNR